MQRAAIAALNDGDAFMRAQIAACHTGRDIVCDALKATGMSRFERPAGAFYLFFSLNGFPDTADLGIRLSPGEAFGPGGGGFMRLCFARNHDDLRTALDSLTVWLTKYGSAIQPVS